MTKYLDTFFEQEHLIELQGYRVQVFASGRVKLSFPDVGNRSTEYYAEWLKRDTEAYRRQRKRSVEQCLIILTLWTPCAQREARVLFFVSK